MTPNTKIRIIFFIGSLRSGGKERRLIELLTYLTRQGIYELMLVVTKDDVHYPYFFSLDVQYQVIEKKVGKNKFLIPFELYKICKKFQPHLLHVWGKMQVFYSLPSVIGKRIPLVNSQITAAPPERNRYSFKYFVDQINFRLSDVILSNSYAGIKSYNPPTEKTRVIYNGINLDRFKDLPDKECIKRKYDILTPFSVIKVASFTPNKDYDLFFRIAERVTEVRDDITFLGVGGPDKNDSDFKKMQSVYSQNKRIRLLGKVEEVEALINVCTIGILFTNKSVHGEGISNAILEYMCLGKPVIANDAGGTSELIIHNKNGYLIEAQTEDEIVGMVLQLIDNSEKCICFGKAGKKMIDDSFSLEKMGAAFADVYRQVLERDGQHSTLHAAHSFVGVN